MPEANGPCRFGQYLHLIRRTLDDLGYTDVPVHHHHLQRRLLVDRRSTRRTSSAPPGAPSLAHDTLMKMLLRDAALRARAKGAPTRSTSTRLRDAGAALSLRDVSHRERLARHRERHHRGARPLSRRAGALRRARAR